MRSLKIIFSVVLLFIGSNAFSQPTKKKESNLIETILKEEWVIKSLSLEDTSYKASIRIFDTENYTSIKDGFYVDRAKGIFIPYYLKKELKFDMNSGKYRDVIIGRIKYERKNVKVFIILPRFKVVNNNNEMFYLELEYTLDTNGNYIKQRSHISPFHYSDK